MALNRDLTRERIERRLAAHRPASMDAPGVARSAVAAVLRFDRGSPDVLLMKRAERPGDSWSGHISLPGGREAPGDPDLHATAVRETREEVGLHLDQNARLIGQLDTIQAVARGRVRPLTITPFVFVQTRQMALELGHEAVNAFWFPLERAISGELSDSFEYRFGGDALRLPCWRYEDHVIWGLTYRMMDHLLDVVAR
jgi:8-oxo-dGTP pyrophosphatase MutT (NUDIX family)